MWRAIKIRSQHRSCSILRGTTQGSESCHNLFTGLQAIGAEAKGRHTRKATEEAVNVILNLLSMGASCKD
jgi:hypothetical protein